MPVLKLGILNQTKTAITKIKNIMKELIDGIDKDDFILGILRNIEDYMPKARRKRTSNIRIIQDFILRRTSKGGRASAYEQCIKLGIDPDSNTFY